MGSLGGGPSIAGADRIPAVGGPTTPKYHGNYHTKAIFPDAVSRDGVGRDGVSRDGVGRDGVGRDGVGRDGVGSLPTAAGNPMDVASVDSDDGPDGAPLSVVGTLRVPVSALVTPAASRTGILMVALQESHAKAPRRKELTVAGSSVLNRWRIGLELR